MCRRRFGGHLGRLALLFPLWLFIVSFPVNVVRISLPPPLHRTHQIFHKDSHPVKSWTWCNILPWLLLRLPITASWTETKLEGRNAGRVMFSAARWRQSCLKASALPSTHCSTAKWYTRVGRKAFGERWCRGRGDGTGTNHWWFIQYSTTGRSHRDVSHWFVKSCFLHSTASSVSGLI